MTIVNNPFALLNDESAEDISQTQPVKAAPKAKIPLKETFQPKAIPGKTVQKKPTNRNTQKDGSFEEKPEHKDAAVHHDKKSHKQKKDDRKSHNPSKSGEKKESSGKASWGNELEAQLEVAEGAAAAADDEEGSPVVPEPEENFKSLADYQAEKEAARIAAQVNIRKPNEGVDESQWKKLTPLVKEEALDDFMFTGKAQKEKERKNKEKAKTVLVIEQTFAPAPRPERTNTDRKFAGKPKSANGTPGSSRPSSKGGNGKGPAKSGPKSGAAGGKSAGPKGRGGPKSGGPVNVMDPKAFPSLG